MCMPYETLISCELVNYSSPPSTHNLFRLVIKQWLLWGGMKAPTLSCSREGELLVKATILQAGGSAITTQ